MILDTISLAPCGLGPFNFRFFAVAQ